MMAPSAQAHSRTYSLLLFQKLLNLRDGASPLTLILDSLEQDAGPLVREFIGLAKTNRFKVLLVSFATVKKPAEIDIMVKARGKSLATLRSEITTLCPSPTTATAAKDMQKTLLLIDTINPLCTSDPHGLMSHLTSIITPTTSALAVYHTDIPLTKNTNEYAPHPLTLLMHLATAVLRVSNLNHTVQMRRAADRSLAEPEFGLRENREGVLVGLGGPAEGIVVDMEVRRRSGRAVAGRFVMSPSNITVFTEHPLFAPHQETAVARDIGEAREEVDTTFNLGLTEKQRKDRAGVVLPYFDAQTDIGGGEGGRILYEMGREDDWDEEEDEI